MKIVPIKVDVKILYENRHLFTDDPQYNSVVVSKLINQDILLLDRYTYSILDNDHKKKLYDDSNNKYILVKDGLCYQCVNTNVTSYYLFLYTWELYHWEFNRKYSPSRKINILTIVK